MGSDNSIIYLTLALCCFWLVLDNFMGNKYLDGFIKKVLNDE